MNQQVPKITSTRLEYIDGLKVIMLLCVIFCHLSEYLGVKYDQLWQFIWSTCGAIGVSGFIILSGFGLTYSRLVSNKADLQILPYLYKRFLRILPLYYLAFFTYLLIVNLIDPLNFLTHILLIHTFFKDYSHNPGSLWFIGLIVQYYLVFPIAYKIMSLKKGLFVLGITAVLLYSLAIILENEGFYARETFISFGIEFSIGMIMALYAYKGEIKRYSEPLVIIFSILEIGLFLLSVKTSLIFQLPYYIFHPIMTLSKICFFIVALNLLLMIKTFYSGFYRFTNIIYAMSLASYSAYLFHRPILTILTRGSAWDWILSNGFSGLQKFIILSIFSIPLIFIVSYWIQKAHDSMQKKLISTFHRNPV